MEITINVPEPAYAVGDYVSLKNYDGEFIVLVRYFSLVACSESGDVWGQAEDTGYVGWKYIVQDTNYQIPGGEIAEPGIGALLRKAGTNDHT